MEAGGSEVYQLPKQGIRVERKEIQDCRGKERTGARLAQASYGGWGEIMCEVIWKEVWKFWSCGRMEAPWPPRRVRYRGYYIGEVGTSKPGQLACAAK